MQEETVNLGYCNPISWFSKMLGKTTRQFSIFAGINLVTEIEITNFSMLCQTKSSWSWVIYRKNARSVRFFGCSFQSIHLVLVCPNLKL